MINFSPAQVTRNKLSFRDDLPKLLLESEPLERNLDKKFRDWLARRGETKARKHPPRQPPPPRERTAQEASLTAATPCCCLQVPR